MPELPSPNLSLPAPVVVDERFELLVEGVREYAIIMLDTSGRIAHWNCGAKRTFGYEAAEVMGRNTHLLYSTADARLGLPEAELGLVRQQGHCQEEGWRVRKDGSRFWANVVLTELRDRAGGLRGFVKIISDVTGRKKVEWLERDRRQVLELVARNEPLDRVLSQLAEMTERQCPGMKASILLLRDGILGGMEGPKLPHQFLEAPDPRALRLAAGLQSLACERGETLLATDLQQDSLWEDFATITSVLDLRVCWSLSVSASGGEATGMILLFGQSSGGPTAAERDAIETAGKLLAIALEHRQLGDQLAHQAQHDQLTTLPNRMLFSDRLQIAQAHARRGGQHVALLLMDLDRFKYVNDTLGHHVGDQLLQSVAARWQGTMRESDTLARLGGDEFAMILPDLADRRDAVRVAQRVVDALREPLQIAGHELFVTASIGIAVFPIDGDDPVALQRNADVAMYRAKSMGGNGYECFEAQMNARAMERLALEGHLRRSVDACLEGNSGDGDFDLHYQPQADPFGKLAGFEALLRWRHPKLGMVPPEQFIPVAEETGLMRALGAWVLREACRQNRRWQLAGHRPVKIAVNVSALQFAQAGFAAAVATVLSETGLEPRWLELEVTESLLVKNTRDAIVKLAALRKLGVSVAIDDFGTGYSSLAYLHRLPFDTLKIDCSFVGGIGPHALTAPNGSDTAVIRAVASLAHSLGVGVVAEGVEADHQREFLLRLGCKGMQGYLFGKPVPAAEAENALRTESLLPGAAVSAI